MDTDFFGIDANDFDVDEIDNNLIGFLNSDSNEAESGDEEQGYSSQIETIDSKLKFQEWQKQRESDQSPNKRKLSDDEDDEDTEHDIEQDIISFSHENVDHNDKYKELIRMEQSTSGLDLENIRESQLFREYRVIGLVCNDVPFYLQKCGDCFFIATCIGKSFQKYEGKGLKLIESARSGSEKINALLFEHEIVFTAVGSNVVIWHRVKKIGVLSKHVGKVYILKLMGNLLITVAEDKMLYVWDFTKLFNTKHDKFDDGFYLNRIEPVRSINFNANCNEFINKNDVIQCIAHPPTYLNKIIIGFISGKVQLWNISTGQHIYTFKNHLAFNTLNAKNIGVTVLEPAPILDVVGIGFSNGIIVIHNMKTDKTVMIFEHYNHRAYLSTKNNNFSISNDVRNGRINGLTFRSDGIPFLVSVGSDNNIVVWNLKTRKLENIHYDAHSDRITAARFVSNESVLVTSSVDNSLKLWLFDDDMDYGTHGGAGQVRLLKSRSGHSAQPYLCHFHGRNRLLSTSGDRELRMSWINRDFDCAPLGQSKYGKDKAVRVPRIKSMATRAVKARFWSNLVTVHNNDNQVRLWSTCRHRLDAQRLRPAHSDKASLANVSCAIISRCGHFAYVGRTSGVIDKYNLQSGKHRMQIAGAHEKGGIRALHLSLFNNVLISIGGGDGLVKFWSVLSRKGKGGKCQHVIEAIGGEIISHSAYDARSNLLAVGCDSLMVYLFDASNGKMVRQFNLNAAGNGKYKSNISCMRLSPNCGWLLIASMDGSVRVYDLESGLIIDWFRFKNAVTSLAFAASNTFVATTHCNEMGIHIWANKHHFQQPFLKNVGQKPIAMDAAPKQEQEKEAMAMEEKVGEIMAKAVKFGDESESESESEESSSSLVAFDCGMEADDDDEEEVSLPDVAGLHLGEENDFITMSSNPKSVWKNLGNWDLILQRNRPSMKVKKNIENIPFFIPTKLHHHYIEMDSRIFSAEMKQKEAEIENSRKLKEYGDRKKMLKNIDVHFQVDHNLMANKYNTCSTLVYFLKKDGKNSKNALDYLLSLSPSQSDAEIHSIAITIGTSKNELMLILEFFIFELNTNRNFEHLQSFIALFLKIHSDLIIKHCKTLNFLVAKLEKVCQQKWKKINQLFQSNLCLIQFYSHIQQ